MNRYLFVFLFLIFPAIISGINGRYDYMTFFLFIALIIAFLEKRKDIADKLF